MWSRSARASGKPVSGERFVWRSLEPFRLGSHMRTLKYLHDRERGGGYIMRHPTVLATMAVTATAIPALAGCGGGAASSNPAANSSPPSSAPSPVSGDSGDCLFGANGADVQVGIANPTQSCSQWVKDLAGAGLVWYPITAMAAPGSPGAADEETMQETCDLSHGTQEPYVEDAGGMSYGNDICNGEEQNGWTPEGGPGPLAIQAQQAEQAQASASASASQASANADQEQTAQEQVTSLDDTSFSGDLSSLAGDVQGTNNDLSALRNDAASGNGDQCINASTTVYNDVLTTVANDAGSLARDISTARSAISTVQAAQAVLSQAGLPGTPGAGVAVTSAQAAISSAISAANADIGQANADLDTAYQVADSVGTGACAGDGPGSPPAGVSDLS